MNKVSIIVGIDNPYEIVDNFFEQLFQLNGIEGYEVIVVTDGDNNIKNANYLSKLQKIHSNLQCITLPEKMGYSKVNNIGAHNATGEFLLFVNSDVFPEKDSVNQLCQFLIDNPSVGVVQGLLIYPQNGLVQSTGHIFGSFFNSHALEGSKIDEKIVQETQERQGLTSAFYMTRNSIFKQVGGLDEFYYNAWDGLDLSLKIHFCGYKCIYYPQAIAYHVRGGARRYSANDETYQAAYFWTKWGSRLSNDLVPLLIKQLPEDFVDSEYLIINCSVISSIDAFVKDLNIKLSEIIQIRDRFEDKIDFYMNLSYAIQSYRGKIFFITNSILNISGNKKWIESRNGGKKDLVVDFKGNVKFLSELL